MLTPALVKGRILSADAMHTQRFFCQQVTRWGGDYLLIAKDNQSNLHENLELFFEDLNAPDVRWETARDVSNGHGRLDLRVLTCSPDLRDYLAREWCGIEQVFRLERTTREKGQQVSHEVHYPQFRHPTRQSSFESHPGRSRLGHFPYQGELSGGSISSHCATTRQAKSGGGGFPQRPRHSVSCFTRQKALQ